MFCVLMSHVPVFYVLMFYVLMFYVLFSTVLCFNALLFYCFLVHINDLPNELKSNAKLYTDDTSLFTIIKDKNESANISQQ